MKKLILLIVILPLFALGQTYNKAIRTNIPGIAPIKQLPQKFISDNAPLTSTGDKPIDVPYYKKITSRGSKYSSVEIGNSLYALQTNASVARRIIVYPDGQKSAVWTTSKDESTWPSRGTGYNHYSGTAWLHSIQNRVENIRCGWPNIGTVKKAGTDVEYIMSHYAPESSTAASGGVVYNINGGIGQTTSWTQKILDQVSGPIWHRTAECGDNICIISTYSDTNKYVNKVQAPTVYSRYKVSKDSFDQKYIMLPGYDTSLFKFGRGDDYAIDSRGSTVAIIMAPYYNHVVLWKSTDSGATFTRTIIDTFAIPKPRWENDTQNFDYPDGSVSVIIDNEGYCKAVWSYFVGFKFTNTNDSGWYRPAQHGLFYWNEKNGAKGVIPTAKVWDRNGNGLLDLENGFQATRPGTDGFLHLIDAYGLTNPLLTFPQLTIDDSNNIFVIYSAIIEKAFISVENFSDGTPKRENLRDVYVVYSKDDGASWGPQQNITNNPLMEDVFASVSKNCHGDSLHIIFQEDDDPGTDVQNYDPPTTNLEYYIGVPISDILANLVGPGDSAGVGINDQIKSFEIGNNYPNPFTGETFVDIKLNNRSNVVVTMNNTLGQQVLENTYSNVPSGKNTISIDASDLDAGIYFLSVKVGNDVKTIKTMIR